MELPKEIVCNILLKVFDQSIIFFGNCRLVNKEIERIFKSSFVLKNLLISNMFKLPYNLEFLSKHDNF